MEFMAEPAYSLRYDKDGVETEKNLISPLLTSPDVKIEDLDESIRYQYQIIREGIETARKKKYDFDVFTEYAVIELAVYKDLSGHSDVTPLMKLYSRADKVDILPVSEETVMFTAVYLFTGAEQAK